MFCNKCGNELDDNAKFCGKCGNKIEQNKFCNTMEFGSASGNNINKNTFDTEQMIAISSKLIDILKERKYFVLGAVGIIILMLIIIPIFNKKDGNLPDNAEIAKTSSLSSDLKESSYISDENINNEDSELNQNSSISNEYNQEINEESSYTEIADDTIIDVYMGQGSEYIDYANKQYFPPQFVDRLKEIGNSVADGSLGMRFEIITLPAPANAANSDPLFGAEVTKEDMSNFIETIKSHLVNWGINIYESFDDNKWDVKYLGLMYRFSETDVNVYLDINRGIYKALVWK